jgi:DNA-binding MarR family transcriptional regulator
VRSTMAADMIARADTAQARKGRRLARSFPGKPGMLVSPGLSELTKANASRRPGRQSVGRRPGPVARVCPGEPVRLKLTKAQVSEIVRKAGHGEITPSVLAALDAPGWSVSATYGLPALIEDRNLSRALLLGLFVLTCFSTDRADLGISDIARMLEMSASTAHRYVATLLSVGLLERDQTRRRYRLVEARCEARRRQ